MPSSWRSLYPFDSKYLDMDGHRFHYVDEGLGKPLLLVHGNPTWSFYFRDLIRAWKERHRVIAVDHMGCGLSDKPANWSYTLRGHVANLSAFMRRLDLGDVTLAGHDWGGAIALGAAQAERDRVARIVLFNTGAWPPEHIPARINVCRTPILGQFAVQGLNVFLRAAFRMALVHPERMTPAIREGYLAPYGNWNARRAIYRFVRDIPSSPSHETWDTLAQIERRLPELAHLPVKLIWGMQDWCFTPACLERFLTYFPQAEVHRLANAGHWVVEDAADEIIPWVEEFVSREAKDATNRNGNLHKPHLPAHTEPRHAG